MSTLPALCLPLKALKAGRRNAETELDWTGVDSIVNFLYHGSVDLWRKKDKKNL
jgi:hypothetical protein